MLKSDKIRRKYLVVNCVGLRTFWTPLVLHWIFTVSNDCHYFEKLLLFKLHDKKIFAQAMGGFNPHQPAVATPVQLTGCKRNLKLFLHNYT